MRCHYTATVLALGLCALVSQSCGKSSEGMAKPVQTIPWSGQGRGFREYGQTDNGLFGQSVKPELLETWKWEDGTLRKDVSCEIPGMLYTAILADGRYVACKEPESGAWPLVVGSIASKKVIKKWDAPEGWGWRSCPIGISRNAAFGLVTIHVDVGHPPAGYDRRRRFRAGVIDLRATELRWVDLEVVSRGGNDGVRQTAISNDGRYAAIGSWDNGMVVIDTVAQKVLWNKKVPNTWGAVDYVALSLDGSRVYAGESSQGCVLVLETMTGKVLNQWFTNETGGKEHGDRVVCVTLSPDDKWVAAAAGNIYLFSTGPEEKMVVLRGAGGIALSFSPDSRRLASMGGGRIGIWEVPSGDPGVTQPKQTPAAGGKSVSP